MSVITTITGIPLYTTTQEALAWARARGLSGYHTHGWQGQTGYMGGASHSIATQGLTPSPSTPTTTTTSGGGGGGY